jgi:hypothetical protein
VQRLEPRGDRSLLVLRFGQAIARRRDARGRPVLQREAAQLRRRASQHRHLAQRTRRPLHRAAGLLQPACALKGQSQDAPGTGQRRHHRLPTAQQGQRRARHDRRDGAPRPRQADEAPFHRIDIADQPRGRSPRPSASATRGGAAVIAR